MITKEEIITIEAPKHDVINWIIDNMSTSIPDLTGYNLTSSIDVKGDNHINFIFSKRLELDDKSLLINILGKYDIDVSEHNKSSFNDFIKQYSKILSKYPYVTSAYHLIKDHLINCRVYIVGDDQAPAEFELKEIEYDIRETYPNINIFIKYYSYFENITSIPGDFTQFYPESTIDDNNTYSHPLNTII